MHSVHFPTGKNKSKTTPSAKSHSVKMQTTMMSSWKQAASHHAKLPKQPTLQAGKKLVSVQKATKLFVQSPTTSQCRKMTINGGFSSTLAKSCATRLPQNFMSSAKLPKFSIGLASSQKGQSKKFHSVRKQKETSAYSGLKRPSPLTLSSPPKREMMSLDASKSLTNQDPCFALVGDDSGDKSFQD